MRVRTARNRETAQWWGVNPDGPNGLAAHLWTDPTADPDEARVFWSPTPKARTFKLSVAADKLAPRVNTKGKVTIDTDKAAWNPGLVEIAVLGCHSGDGDLPEALALATHQLRQAPDLPDALSLPLPLHLAGLAQEYVLPTQNEDGGDGGDVGDALDSVADADSQSVSSGSGAVSTPGAYPASWRRDAGTPHPRVRHGRPVSWRGPGFRRPPTHNRSSKSLTVLRHRTAHPDSRHRKEGPALRGAGDHHRLRQRNEDHDRKVEVLDSVSPERVSEGGLEPPRPIKGTSTSS